MGLGTPAPAPAKGLKPAALKPATAKPLAVKDDRPLRGFTLTSIDVRLEDDKGLLPLTQKLARERFLARMAELGIHEISIDSPAYTDDTPVLSLKATADKTETEGYVYKMDLALMETVIRAKDAGRAQAPKFTAITYRKALSAHPEEPLDKAQVLEMLEEVLNNFVMDYSVANTMPRKAKGAPSMN
jgi:hypothetical protein